MSNAHKYANEKLITELLPIIDSMVRAQEGVDAEDAQAQSMLEGMNMTLGLLETTLIKFGLKVIAPEIGEAFNPDYHEAMSMVPNPDLPKNFSDAIVAKRVRAQWQSAASGDGDGNTVDRRISDN